MTNPTPQPVYVVQAAPPSNSIATAALVMGLIAFFLGLIPLAGIFVAALPALLAIIFGFVGISTANRYNGLNKTAAIIGVWGGFSPAIVAVLFFIASTISSAANN